MDEKTPAEEPEEKATPLVDGTAPDKFQDLEDKNATQMSDAFVLDLEEGQTLFGRLSTMKDKLMEDFSQRETWRRPYEYDLWNNAYRLYFSNQFSTKTKTRSKVFVPVINNIIQVATSKLIGFVSNSDDIFDVETPSNVNENIANNIKNLIDDQLDQNNFAKKFEDFIVQLLLYGTSYFAVDWEEKWADVFEDVEVVTMVPNILTGIPEPQIETKPTKKYKCVANRPKISFLDIADVYPAQNYGTIEDMPGIFIRKWINVGEFKDMLEKGNYFGNKEAALKLSPSNQYQESRQLRKVDRGEMSSAQDTQIELLEFWGPYDLDGDGRKEECQIVIANRELVVRAVPNPFHHQKRPVVKCNLGTAPGEFYGISLIEPIIPMQEELNTVRRQKLDMTTVSINRMWMRRNGCSVEDSQLVSRANGVIDVDDINTDLRLVEPITIPSDAFTDSQQIINDMMNTTVPQSLTGSVNDMKASGQPGAVKANIGQALEKFATYAKNIEEQALIPLLDMMYQLDLQYLNSNEIIRSFYGNLFSDPSVVTPALIRSQVTFKMKALSDLLNKDVRTNQILAFLSSPAGAMLSPQSQDYVLKELADLMGFDANQVNAAVAVPTAMAPGGQIPLPGITGGVLPNAGAPVLPPPMLGQPGAGATPASLGIRGSTNLPIGR